MAENLIGNTDTGRMRDNNEDAFIAEKIWNGELMAACVIDGVGGYEGGEVAAGIAREVILEHLEHHTEDVLATMKEAVAAANEKIYNEKIQNKERQSMACVLTLAVADITNNQFWYAHIGDTRLYLYRDSSLVKVTKDHSFVGYLEDSKRLSESEAMRHPKRNEINKALGFDPNMARQPDYMETGQSPFLPGDLLLLCSDGLTDLVDSNTIASILETKNSLQQKSHALIDAANDAGGKDNITVVLVQNDKAPVQHHATKPVTLKKKDVQQEEPGKETEPPLIIFRNKTGGKAAIVVLSILCLLLMGLAYWLWMSQEKKPSPPPAIAQKQRNPSEKSLLKALDSSATTEISLTDSSAQVLVSDTIFIRRDSLHVIGNGKIIRRDSSYHGPAFVISPETKFVLLENVVFENFDVGILTPPKALYLVNVKFNNCAVPILTQHRLPPGVSLNVQLLDSINYNYDTTQKQIQ